jgi:hypothetical protein
MLVARERRSRFGRICLWAFWLFQAAMPLLMLGTCAAVAPSLSNPDPEVAMGAGMFGAVALGTLWVAWPVGTVLLGLLALFTRGRKRLIPVPPEGGPPDGTPPQGSWPPPPPRPILRRDGGSVPPTGPPPPPA